MAIAKKSHSHLFGYKNNISSSFLNVFHEDCVQSLSAIKLMFLVLISAHNFFQEIT